MFDAPTGIQGENGVIHTLDRWYFYLASEYRVEGRHIKNQEERKRVRGWAEKSRRYSAK